VDKTFKAKDNYPVEKLFKQPSNPLFMSPCGDVQNVFLPLQQEFQALVTKRSRPKLG